MWYRHDKLSLELVDGKAKLYNDNKIMFIGGGYAGITMFINESKNHPDVKSMFKSQLEKREKVKWKDIPRAEA